MLTRQLAQRNGYAASLVLKGGNSTTSRVSTTFAMNGTRKNPRGKGARAGENATKKKSKTDVSLKWDEDIGSSDDESVDKLPADNEEDDEEEETAEETRKR